MKERIKAVIHCSGFAFERMTDWYSRENLVGKPTYVSVVDGDNAWPAKMVSDSFHSGQSGTRVIEFEATIAEEELFDLLCQSTQEKDGWREVA